MGFTFKKNCGKKKKRILILVTIVLLIVLIPVLYEFWNIKRCWIKSYVLDNTPYIPWEECSDIKIKNEFKMFSRKESEVFISAIIPSEEYEKFKKENKDSLYSEKIGERFNEDFEKMGLKKNSRTERYFFLCSSLRKGPFYDRVKGYTMKVYATPIDNTKYSLLIVMQ